MVSPVSTGAMHARRRAIGSDRLQVFGRELALLAFLHLVADLLTLVQVADPRPLDGGDVHEHVLRAVIRLDESIALLWVEPFDRACRHRTTPSYRRRARCEPDYSSWGELRDATVPQTFASGPERKVPIPSYIGDARRDCQDRLAGRRPPEGRPGVGGIAPELEARARGWRRSVRLRDTPDRMRTGRAACRAAAAARGHQRTEPGGARSAGRAPNGAANRGRHDHAHD